MTEETTEGGKGLSRRSFITKGAIAGGAVVWATPVIDSLVSRAAAASAPPGECGCNPNGASVLQVDTSPGAVDTAWQFTASQSGSSAVACDPGCAEGQAPPTTYVWSFPNGNPPNYTAASTTQQTPAANAAASYNMGDAIPATNCPGAGAVSVLHVAFSANPGSFKVQFTANVECAPDVSCQNTASATTPAGS